MDSIAKLAELLTFVKSINGLSGLGASHLLIFEIERDSRAHDCVADGNSKICE